MAKGHGQGNHVVTQESPRPLPQSTVQATGQMAIDVVSGLKQSPMLLALVVLNVIAIGGAMWFLRELAENNHQTMTYLIQHCIDGQPKPPT